MYTVYREDRERTMGKKKKEQKTNAARILACSSFRWYADRDGI